MYVLFVHNNDDIPDTGNDGEKTEQEIKDAIVSQLDSQNNENYEQYQDTEVSIEIDYPKDWDIYPKNLIKYDGFYQKDIILRTNKGNVVNILFQENGSTNPIGVQTEYDGRNSIERDFDEGTILFPLIDEDSETSENGYQIFFRSGESDRVKNYIILGSWKFSVVLGLNSYTPDELGEIYHVLNEIRRSE